MANEKRLIDANELIRFCDNEIDKYEDSLNKHERNYAKAMCVVKKIARTFPTVDAVEVVHAVWLDGYGIHGGIKKYESIDCSNCGDYFKIESHDREYWKKRFKVCPFCGAKMDGKREDGVGDV